MAKKQSRRRDEGDNLKENVIHINRVSKVAKSGDKEIRPQLALLERLRRHLDEAGTHDAGHSDDQRILVSALRTSSRHSAPLP